MPRKEGQKRKLLVLLDILARETDEKHPLSVPQLVERLQERGVVAERKSVYDDLNTLNNMPDSPYEIVQQRGRGGGYYMTEAPFELAELTVRVEAVLRRYHKLQDKISAAGMEVDTLSKTVRKNGRPVELTAKEYELLLLFLRNRNIALYRDRIYEEVWEGEFDPDSRTVDIHVQRLKKKAGLEDSIVSVRGVGYRLEAPET